MRLRYRIRYGSNLKKKCKENKMLNYGKEELKLKNILFNRYGNILDNDNK